MFSTASKKSWDTGSKGCNCPAHPLIHNNTTYVRLPSLPITSSLLSSLLFLSWQCLINFNSSASSLRELPPPLLSTLAFFCLVFWSTSLPKQLERKIMPSRMNVQKPENEKKNDFGKDL